MGDGGVKEIANTLQFNKTLTQVGFQGDYIGDEEAKEIAEALKFNNTITVFYLQFNKIGKEGAKDIANALKINKTLTHFHLQSNYIEAEGAKEIANALKINKILIQLHLQDNKIGLEGIKEIANALQINNTLTQLHLWDNNIGVAGAKEIARALKMNKTLTLLHLKSNHIGVAGAKQIANALQFNKTLMKLYFWEDLVGHEGAKHFANALQINSSLLQLHFKVNKMGDEGAKEIANALQINTTLTQLYLWANEIGAEGAKGIANALKINKTLTQLNLQNNDIGEEGAKEIATALQINDTLAQLHLGKLKIGAQGEHYLISCLANNLAIKSVDFGERSAGIEAICERNKHTQFKKVVKILVVGEARVGKTSFVKSLKNEKFEQQESITRVTEVSSIQWQQQQEDAGSQVESKVFDFGGQEIFNFIHPIFQTSQHAIVILVANVFAPNHNKQMEKHEEIRKQISNLRNIYEEILLVLTCFEGREDREFPLISTDLSYGLDTDRVFRISNKERCGIACIKGKILSMLHWRSVGWTISHRCSVLADYFAERNKKEPMILNFNEGIENDLLMLHNSGWIFRSKDRRHIFTSDILITKMFQGLFRIPGNDFTEEWEIEEVKNGVISERKFANLFTSLLVCVFKISNGKYIEECCRAFLEFLESFSICWRVQKRTLDGLRSCVMFPSLLPPFLADQANLVGRKNQLWEQIENKQKASLSHIRRKITISELSGSWDSKKVMDFIFPRLMVKLWDEMIDLELCWSDKFVLRGDLHIEHLSLELENVENLLIITREGDGIDLVSIGSCYGTLATFGDELAGLVEEFKDCFGIPRRVEVQSKIFCCQTTMESFHIGGMEEMEEIKRKLEVEIACEGCGRTFSGIERIVNVWDSLRLLYLLKASQKDCECESLIGRIEKTAGELVKFPVNKIATKRQMKTHVDKRGGMKVSHLRFHRLLGEGAEGPVYQCCTIPKESINTAVVGKYMACKIGKAGESILQSLFEEERSTKALQSLLSTLSRMWINPTNRSANQTWNEFATQFLNIKGKLDSKTANKEETIQQLTNVLNATEESSALGASWESEKNTLMEILEVVNKMNGLSNESDVLTELFESLHNNEPPEIAFQRAKSNFVSQESEAFQAIIKNIEEMSITPNSAFSKAVRFWATHFFRLNPPLVEAIYNRFKTLELYLPSSPEVLNLSKCVTLGDNATNSKKVLAEILKARKMIFHKNELQILQELENSATVGQTHTFLCSTLLSFADDLDPRLLPDSVQGCEMKFDGKEPVVVDLMNIFDGTLEMIANEAVPDEQETALLERCLQRLVFFYQVCLGVFELKKAKVAHKDIKLANILINKKLGWACIADFGLAVRYGDGGVALPKQKNLEMCGVYNQPPEIKLLKENSNTPVDKIDVFSLGSILQDFIISPLLKLPQDVLGGFVELKNQIEKKEYEERLDIEDLIAIVAYFLLFLGFCVNHHTSHVLQTILKIVEASSNENTGSYKLDLKCFKMLILLSSNRRFSIEEKMVIEILMEVDLARTLKLVQTRLGTFYQHVSAKLLYSKQKI